MLQTSMYLIGTRVKAPQISFLRLAGYSTCLLLPFLRSGSFFCHADVSCGHNIVVERFTEVLYFLQFLTRLPHHVYLCCQLTRTKTEAGTFFFFYSLISIGMPYPLCAKIIIFSFSLCVLIKLVMLFCLSECWGLLSLCTWTGLIWSDVGN